MKASVVLKRYAAGDKNFRGANLRGQSFKGQDLQGANFSEADIRSADLTRANLAGANFTGAKCGLQRRCAIILVILSWWLAGISRFLSIGVGYFVSLIFDSTSLESQIAGWASLIILIVFLIVSLRKGFAAVAVAVAVAGVVLFAGAGAGAGAVAVAGAVAGAGAVLFAGAGIYIGWRALKGDKRDAWVRSVAIAFAAIGGTSFRGANLTNANFSSAKLKSTDLRKATLTRVRWYKAKMLDRVRPGSSYLQDAQIRQWLIGEGKDKNFDRQSLRGINLQGAKNLTDASFIGADLSEANLQDTDLSRAKLVQTQLDKTDFTGATLTGACIT